MSWQSLKTLWQHRFVRDVATLQAGTVFSAFLGVVSSAVFARVLGPQTFGEYAVLTAFVALVSIPFDLGVGYATITLLAGAYGRHDRRAVVEVVVFFVKARGFICFAIGVPVMAGAIGLAQALYGSSRLGLLAVPLLAGQLVASLFFLTQADGIPPRLTLMAAPDGPERDPAVLAITVDQVWRELESFISREGLVPALS